MHFTVVSLANQRAFRGGGMDIFWNHTMMNDVYDFEQKVSCDNGKQRLYRVNRPLEVP